MSEKLKHNLEIKESSDFYQVQFPRQSKDELIKILEDGADYLSFSFNPENFNIKIWYQNHTNYDSDNYTHLGVDPDNTTGGVTGYLHCDHGNIGVEQIHIRDNRFSSNYVDYQINIPLAVKKALNL